MSEQPQGVAQRVIAELEGRKRHKQHVLNRLETSAGLVAMRYMYAELSAEARRVLAEYDSEDAGPYRGFLRESVESAFHHLGLDIEPEESE